MRAGVMERKTAAGAQLTPVGVESRVNVLPKTGAEFPNDLPAEVILNAVREIERQMAFVAEALVAVKTTLKVPGGVDTVDLVSDQKTAEKAADAKFAADYAAKQKTAQDATFTQPSDGWQCPTHGGAEDTTSPKGRAYRRCAEYPECKKFEPPVGMKGNS